MTAAGPVELPAAALLFDLDGVLIDSGALVLDHWRQFAAWYGLDGETLIERVHGVRARDVIAAALPDAPAAVREQAVRRLDELEIADTAGIRALPGAARLLAELGGAPWAVVTAGTAPVAGARLHAAGLPAPAVLVGAEDVPAGKPDPAGYRTAAGRLGIPAQRALVVEDAPVGVAAGRAAGATVLALTTTHPAEQLADADLVVPDLAAVSVRRHGADMLVRLGAGGRVRT